MFPTGFKPQRKMNLKMILRQHVAHNLRPLDQTNAVTVKVFIQPQFSQFLDGTNPVKVEMEYRQTAVIFVDQSERWTGDFFFHAQAGADAFDAGRLAAAQIAEQPYHCSRLKLGRKGSSELKSLPFAFTDESYRRFWRRLVAIGWIVLLRGTAVDRDYSSLWLKGHDG